MIPDAATIARRRHTVTIIVRFLIATYAAWCCYALLTYTILGLILSPLWADYGLVNTLRNAWPSIAADLMRFGILVASFFFEQHLVRWIVPTPRPDHLCPKCNYSLKDLRSPICPECGTNLRA